MNCTRSDLSVYVRALANARVVYDEALQRGFHLRSINVGGDFTSTNLADASHALRYTMTRYFGVLVSDIHCMAEPGQFFVADPFYLACRVSGIHRLYPGPPRDVYINDRIYKDFRNKSVELPNPPPFSWALAAQTVVLTNGIPIAPQDCSCMLFGVRQGVQ